MAGSTDLVQRRPCSRGESLEKLRKRTATPSSPASNRLAQDSKTAAGKTACSPATNKLSKCEKITPSKCPCSPTPDKLQRDHSLTPSKSASSPASRKLASADTPTLSKSASSPASRKLPLSRNVRSPTSQKLPREDKPMPRKMPSSQPSRQLPKEEKMTRSKSVCSPVSSRSQSGKKTTPGKASCSLTERKEALQSGSTAKQKENTSVASSISAHQNLNSSLTGKPGAARITLNSEKLNTFRERTGIPAPVSRLPTLKPSAKSGGTSQLQPSSDGAPSGNGSARPGSLSQPKGGLKVDLPFRIYSTLSFSFHPCGKIPPPVIMVQNVSFRYSDDGPLIYQNLEFGIDLDTRVALVGPNGAGKSTLLKLLAGEVLPSDGMIRTHSHVKIGRYHQHLTEQLELDLSPLDYMMKCYPEIKEREDMRKIVGRYGLTGKQQVSPIRNLSDGQKCRVCFAWLAWQNPHMLFLDEPTNHLDIETIDALADAINEFEGGMMLVSHDFRLIQQVAQEIWVCEKQTITKWNRDILAYKEHLKSKMIRDP
ncbi:UNVERIFIED_CONTAM: hypothetical protein FKN15_075441 [Acipenser sinensis]